MVWVSHVTRSPGRVSLLVPHHTRLSYVVMSKLGAHTQVVYVSNEEKRGGGILYKIVLIKLICYIVEYPLLRPCWVGGRVEESRRRTL